MVLSIELKREVGEIRRSIEVTVFWLLMNSRPPVHAAKPIVIYYVVHTIYNSSKE